MRAELPDKSNVADVTTIAFVTIGGEKLCVPVVSRNPHSIEVELMGRVGRYGADPADEVIYEARFLREVFLDA